MKLSEIARAVGYDDPYYLSRVVKQVTGLPPAAHRPGRGRRRRAA